MTSRHILGLVAALVASAGAAFADPPARLYLTTGAGRQVLAVSIGSSTGVQVGGAQVLVTAASPVTDVTQKSDGGVYYATATDIRRIGQATAVAAVTGVQELRFSAYNCLFYNRAGGVNSVGCGNVGSAAGSGGSGLGLSLFGQILAISGNTVVRIPIDAQGNKGTPTTLVASGLTSPTSIAVAGGKGSNGLERGDFIVTDGRFARHFNGKTGALVNATYASVPQGQTINFADFDAEDHLWLAAMVSTAGTNELNGRVYRADAAGSCADVGGTNCTRAALVPKAQGKYWPAVGLALAPSSRVLTKSIAPAVPNEMQAFTFDFGGSVVEIDGVVIDTCDLRVRASTALAQTATSLINNSLFAPNPYLGDEGLSTIYRVESFKNGTEVDANACVQVSPTTGPFLYFAALTSTEISPRILRCESGCSESELFSWWHTGPIEGDGEGGTRGTDWSDWLIVERAASAANNQIQFCGVGEPLDLDGTSVFNPGSNLTVKAQFSLPGQPCDGANYLTDPNAQFLISIAQVAPVHAKKRFIADSGNSGEPPMLRNAGQTYIFDTSLNEPDGEDYVEGTYEITLTDVTATGARLPSPVTIYFRIGKR